MTRFEYETFKLVDYTTPAIRYQKIMQDIKQTAFNSDGLDYTFLNELRNNMEADFTEEELILTVDEERAFWVRKLGRQAAIEMISTARVSVETMDKISALEPADFDSAVSLCASMAQELDRRSRAAEEMSRQANNI